MLPFLKRIRHSEFFCSFKNDFNNAVNITSRFSWISIFLEALHKVFYVKTWLISLFQCLAASEPLVELSCFDHLSMSSRDLNNLEQSEPVRKKKNVFTFF